MNFTKFINLNENNSGFDDNDLIKFKELFNKHNVSIKELKNAEIVISGNFDNITGILKKLPDNINCTLKCPTSNYERNTWMFLTPVPMYGGATLEW